MQLGLPFTTYAVDGARAADVVGLQLPAFHARAARPDARYDLGCLYAAWHRIASRRVRRQGHLDRPQRSA